MPLLTAHQWADRTASAGLGVTMHVGEFGTTSIGPALSTPGLRCIGHGTHVADDRAFLDELARSGVTLECSLTYNVVLGSAPSYEDHPIRRFVEHEIPVTLATDLPMHVCTTIGREYAVASLLGFSPAELLGFTGNLVAASFTTPTRKAMLIRRARKAIEFSRLTERSAAVGTCKPAPAVLNRTDRRSIQTTAARLLGGGVVIAATHDTSAPVHSLMAAGALKLPQHGFGTGWTPLSTSSTVWAFRAEASNSQCRVNWTRGVVIEI